MPLFSSKFKYKLIFMENSEEHHKH